MDFILSAVKLVEILDKYFLQDRIRNSRGWVCWSRLEELLLRWRLLNSPIGDPVVFSLHLLLPKSAETLR